jgi:hypothetical protein
MIKLANRRIQPLCHLSAAKEKPAEGHKYNIKITAHRRVFLRGAAGNCTMLADHFHRFCVQWSGSVVSASPA